MYNEGDIYRIIQDALDANQIYCTDSKLGDGSTDTYETDTEMIYGDDFHLVATIRHQHEHYPWQPGDDKIDVTKFRIKVERIEEVIMYKSRVFSFNEENLLRDIANYENDTGKEVTKLQCNIKTYQIWVGLYRPELSYAVEIEEISDGVMARYKGIPIIINDKLDDGIVGIE